MVKQAGVGLSITESMSTTNITKGRGFSGTSKFILGIDAGATKIKARITDKSGKILGEGMAGSGNIIEQSPEDFKINISEAVKEAQRQVNTNVYKFDVISFGGAGIDTKEARNKAEKLLREILVADKFLIVNDTQLVLPACSNKNYGIVVIVGTGSNFYGKNKEGKEAYVGGLGSLLSDEGSGYWIGKEALRAIVMANDGRGPKTALTNIILKKFFTKTVRDILNIFHGETFSKRSVANLSILVDEAYKNGDKVAEKIFERATQDIILSINTLVKRLGMREEEFSIVATGGVFHSGFPFRQRIQEALIAKKARFIVCDKEPVAGAIRLALQLT